MPLRTAQTVATRIGPWPEYVLGAAGLLLVGAAAVRRRRSVGERTVPSSVHDGG